MFLYGYDIYTGLSLNQFSTNNILKTHEYAVIYGGLYGIFIFCGFISIKRCYNLLSTQYI